MHDFIGIAECAFLADYHIVDHCGWSQCFKTGHILGVQSKSCHWVCYMHCLLYLYFGVVCYVLPDVLCCILMLYVHCTIISAAKV